MTVYKRLKKFLEYSSVCLFCQIILSSRNNLSEVYFRKKILPNDLLPEKALASNLIFVFMHSTEYFRINDFFQWEYELWIFLHLLNKIIDGRFHFFFVCSLPVSLSLSVSLFSLTGFTLRMSQKLYGSCVVALLVTLSLEVIYRNFFKKICIFRKIV